MTNAAMPIRRAAAAACVVDNRIYLIGGVTEDFHGTPLSAVHAYDPVTDSWTSKTKMPTARAFLSACALGGRIHAIGGGTWSGAFLTTQEVYNPTTDTWHSGSKMPTSRAGLATRAVNGKIYTMGGTQQWYPGQGMSTVEEYDPTPNVSITRQSGTTTLTWRGILQATGTLTGSVWEDVSPQPRCPYTIDPSSVVSMTFYRAREL
jgi:hypothetical protein